MNFVIIFFSKHPGEACGSMSIPALPGGKKHYGSSGLVKFTPGEVSRRTLGHHVWLFGQQPGTFGRRVVMISNSTRRFRMERKGSVSGEWLEQFRFLSDYNRNMEAVYLTILLLAISVKDLSDLHDLLGENARLPHEQLGLLKDHWRKWYQPNVPTCPRVPRPSDEELRWVFSRMYNSFAGLQSWYNELLNRGQAIAYWTIREDEGVQCEMICHRSRDMQMHFQCQLNGCVLHLMFDLHSQDGQERMLGISLTSFELTEPLLHTLRSIRSLRPYSRVWHPQTMCASVYEMPLEDVEDHLRREERGLLSMSSFAPYMEERLRTFGLPVCNVHPVDSHVPE